MKTTFRFIPVLVRYSLIAAAAEKQYSLPIARLTIKSIDEQLVPVSGVKIHLVFMEPDTRKPLSTYGQTDDEGLYSAEGGSDSDMAGEIMKAGYYNGGFPFQPFREAKEGRWQPWNQTNVALMRKIENPIPMYARILNVKVPAQGKACGYDLKEGDWVSPWGKGLVPDLVFTVKYDYTNFNHYDLSMKLGFSNPLDGIQPANPPEEYAHGEFIWHRQAPESGYLPSFEQEKGLPSKLYQIPSAPGIRHLEDVGKLKCYFRVRTVEKDGRIVSALYGKLAAGFEMGISSQREVKVVLNYYLNPTPLDRNMEFDLKQNLFKNLKFDEQSRKP